MSHCHPERIGPYQIAGILGHGGMGTVYRALAPGSGRSLALKVLNPGEPLRSTLGIAALREIFATEAAIMSGLRHPNVAAVLDTSQDEQGRPFYVMEHFCTDLGTLIGEHYLVEKPCRRVQADKAVGYGCQILAALEYIHRAGIIHRDIKPYNMLLSEGDRVKICDFGMAKRGGAKTFFPRGMHIGSPYYTAPEQLSNPEGADERADLYAVGVLLYRMLTGELPAMKGFLLSQVNPLYDSAWDAFFARALSWRPDQRFQGATEMTTSLQQLELHWQRATPSRRIHDRGETQSLRSSPVRVSGDKAREVFAVDQLWQPLAPPCPRFTVRDAETMLDECTGLLWQRYPSAEPVDWESAACLVSALNEIRFAGIAAWRLPTVNELLSLAKDADHPTARSDHPLHADNRDCYWSCDRRSTATSWYVSTCLGFAGWQDNSCRYAVRTAASLPVPPRGSKAGS